MIQSVVEMTKGYIPPNVGTIILPNEYRYTNKSGLDFWVASSFFVQSLTVNRTLNKLPLSNQNDAPPQRTKWGTLIVHILLNTLW